MIRFWDPILERCSKKCASCKKKVYFFGGCITLIKPALSNIPFYYMSLCSMLRKVVGRLEKIQGHFLWERGGERKGYLVNWDMVCKPKEEGGLGTGKLKESTWLCWVSGFCVLSMRGVNCGNLPLIAGMVLLGMVGFVSLCDFLVIVHGKTSPLHFFWFPLPFVMMLACAI